MDRISGFIRIKFYLHQEARNIYKEIRRKIIEIVN